MDRRNISIERSHTPRLHCNINYSHSSCGHPVPSGLPRLPLLRHRGRARQRRHVRPADGHAVGEEQHRQVRWEPQQHHPDGGVSRGLQRQSAPSVSAVEEPVQPGHHAVRQRHRALGGHHQGGESDEGTQTGRADELSP